MGMLCVCEGKWYTGNHYITIVIYDTHTHTHTHNLYIYILYHYRPWGHREADAAEYTVVVGGLVAKSCPTLETLWTVACQAPLSMGFSRQEYWSGLPFPSPGDLPDPGIEPGSPALQADDLPTEL